MNNPGKQAVLSVWALISQRMSLPASGLPGWTQVPRLGLTATALELC